MNKLVTLFVKITGWFPFAILHRTKYFYEDKKVQGRHIKGKAILICNHSNILDHAAMTFCFPFRDLRCVAAEVLYDKNPFFTWFLKSLGCIKVERFTNDFHFINAANKRLDENKVIEMYPESRLPKDGEIRPISFHESFVYLALHSGAKIIPCASNGQYFSKKRLKIYIGKPVDVLTLVDESLSEKENIKKISEYFRQKIIEYSYAFEEK